MCLASPMPPMLLGGTTGSGAGDVTASGTNTYTGRNDFGGGVVEIPHSNSPTVDENGEIAMDDDGSTLVMYISGSKKTFDFTGDTNNYIFMSNGSGTFTLQDYSATQLDGLTDVSGEGTLGKILTDNGDGTYSFQSPSVDVDSIVDDAYSSGWASDDGSVPTRSAIYDYLHQLDADDDGDFTDEGWFPAGTASIVDDAYGAGWASDDGSAPTRSAVYDYLNQLDLDDLAGTADYTPTSGTWDLSSLTALTLPSTTSATFTNATFAGFTANQIMHADASGYASDGAIGDLNADGTLAVDVVAAAEMADADHGDVAWSSGSATVEHFTLTSDSSVGDNNITNVGQIDVDTIAADGATVQVGNTSDNVVIAMDGSPDDDDTYSGVTIRGLTAGEAISQWALVYLSDTDAGFHPADMSVAGSYPTRGIAVAAADDGSAVIILTQGVIRNDDWTFSGEGSTLYLSTSGGITETAPSDSGSCVEIVGWTISDDEAYINISGHYLEVE